MGNCCDGGDRLEITSAKNGTAQATSYGPRHSEHAAPGATTSDGHQRDAPNVRMTTTTAPPQNATPAGLPPDFQLQAPLRYPGDARGVYYQPEGPSAVLSHAFEDKDSSVPQDVSRAATAAAAAALKEATTQAATVVTPTVASTVVAVVSQPEPAVDIVTSASPERQQSANYQPRDVMISYSRTDGDVMIQIKEQLEAHGFSVWVDENSIAAGADFLSKIGEAIIDAKFFICILSEKAVRSKYCRDEVALAYVSNTAIFPVNLQPREHLLPLMDTGLKLQLSNYNWTSLADPASRADSVQALISTMKREMDDLDDQAQTEGGGPGSGPSPPSSPSPSEPLTSSEGAEVGDREVTSPSDVAVTLPGKDVTVADKGGSPVQSPTPTTVGRPPDYKPMRQLRERNRAVMMLQGDDDVSRVMPEQFWNEQFGVVDYVAWDRFASTFLQVFKRQVEATFTSEDQQQLLDILKRELEVGDDERIYKYQLVAFCSVYGDMLAVWPRVHEQARESFAMREVFNMDSSVRVEAIENLGKFRSAAVIDALRDLLTDPDANVRAVATVSLSRTNADDPVTIRHILRTLNDKDRLVREAGCLALGHLRARQAISKLSHLWRNDVISHVRDAAAVALRQIGGQEVEDVMRVTKVLAEEIRSLTEVQA